MTASSPWLSLPDSLQNAVSSGEQGLPPNLTDGMPYADDLVRADEPVLDLAWPISNNGRSATVPSERNDNMPTMDTVWFLGPATWKISHRIDTSTSLTIGKETMKQYVERLQTWFRSWVASGSNPFIHSRLYSAKFPACVQIAYTTLASYIHRTPTNADTILKIVEDRSDDLLRDNAATRQGVASDQWTHSENEEIDLFSQIARLHALIVYQFIGLFDGDVRIRHVAEGRMVVQDKWAYKLLYSASKAFSSSSPAGSQLVSNLPKPSTSSQQQWHLWILSETIRRTWLVAISFLPVFYAIQQRWSACPGSVMYTNRSGLWDAISASSWKRQCLEADIVFLQRFDGMRMLDETRPTDIDEFGMTILDMTFDAEILEEWKNRSDP